MNSETVSVNSIGFMKTVTPEQAAKLIGCDWQELRMQLSRRGGMTHVVVNPRKQKHWYV
jgi:hypothetical protein